MPSNTPSSPSALLSIRQASRLLGVSEVTLRQWTSEGRLKAFITPGGHRRYSETELRRFKETGPRAHGVKDIVARMEQAPAQEMEIAHTRFAGTSWYSRLDADSRANLGHLGRRVYALVLTYVSKPGKREETLGMARDVGREFGECLVEMGLPLTDALEAFMAHRAPLIDAASELIKSRKAIDGRAAEAIPLVTRITDAVLLSLVEAYERHGQREKAEVKA
ncbi:MAG: helix-turn-helix domain-containing protein [Chloroflexi bacterium]|nr:helix-turn-helix domain-containing protein [Chloroflexota bacterium]